MSYAKDFASDYVRTFDGVRFIGFEIYDTRETAKAVRDELRAAGIPARLTAAHTGSGKYGTRLRGFIVWHPDTHPPFYMRKFPYTDEQWTAMSEIERKYA